MLPHALDAPGCQSVEAVHCRSASQSSFHSTCPSEKACPDRGDWCWSPAATQEECLCVCVCLGKTPPQQRLLDLVSQSSKRDSKEYFSMSPSTISQIKIKQEAGTSLCSWFMSMGISILHLNKNEQLQQSFRKILETTSWCVLALWKIISSLIPGTVFVSNPSHSPNFANGCTNAGLNTTEISNSLHMQRTEERRKELVENYTTQC